MLPIIGGIVVGAIAAVAAPSLFSAVTSGVRTMAKEAMKGGMAAYSSASEYVSESGEQFQDLVAEAKSEVNQAKNTNVKG
ncbi:DUF5132 domain-containing protein [uncultured Nitrospira sp.]|uniref:DUF5132 domain-containing protein n=1 Tax=uncultured Nitrospira sp. TaxID=157176 RepID=UPI003140809E